MVGRDRSLGFQLLSLPGSHVSSRRANSTNFEIGLIMSSINSLGLVTQSLASAASLILFQVWQRELRSPSSGPGHDGGTRELPTGDHELRSFGTAHSGNPSLGWKLAVVVTKPMHPGPHLALTWPTEFIPMFLVYT